MGYFKLGLTISVISFRYVGQSTVVRRIVYYTVHLYMHLSFTAVCDTWQLACFTVSSVHCYRFVVHKPTSQQFERLGWTWIYSMSKRKDPHVRLEVETHLLLNIKSFLDKTKPLSGKLFKTVVGGKKKRGGVCWHGRPGSYSGCLKSPLVTDKWAGQLLL